jgi:hypothetical protein
MERAEETKTGGITTCEDKHIVKKPAKCAPEERRHHGDPEVVVARAPYFMAVAEHVAYQSRAFSSLAHIPLLQFQPRSLKEKLKSLPKSLARLIA